MTDRGKRSSIDLSGFRFKVLSVITVPISVLLTSVLLILERLTGRSFILTDLSAFGPSVDLLAGLSSKSVKEYLLSTPTYWKFTFLSGSVVDCRSLECVLGKLLNRHWGARFVPRSSQAGTARLISYILKWQNRLFMYNQMDLRNPRVLGPSVNLLQQRVLTARKQFSDLPNSSRDETRTALLSSMRVPKNAEYVCFSIRTPKYKTLKSREWGIARISDIDAGQSFRNTAASSYRPAVEYLVKEGLKVLLIADEKWFPDGIGFGDIDGLFCVPRECIENYELQLTVQRGAIASIHGGVGGAATVPWSLGVPVAIANWVPLDGLIAPKCQSIQDLNPFLTRNGDVPFPISLERTIVLPKRYKSLPTSEILSMSESSRYKVYSDRLFKDRNIMLVDNSPLEVVDLVKDLLTALASGWGSGHARELPHQKAWKTLLFDSYSQRRVGQGGHGYELGFRGFTERARSDFYYASLSPTFALCNKEWLI